MLSGFLIPTERPPTDIDIKRALLVFEQVHLLDPTDREMLPPEHFMFVSAGMRLFAGNTSALRLGKLRDYDSLFDQTLTVCRAAEHSGHLVVRERPKLMGNAVAIGGAPLPEGWPDSASTWNVFKHLSNDPELLKAALRGFLSASEVVGQDAAELAPGGRAMKFALIHEPSNRLITAPLPEIDLPEVPNELVEIYRTIAAARIGTLVKSLGMCDIAGLQPVALDNGINGILSEIQDKYHGESAIALAHMSDEQRTPLVRELLDEPLQEDVASFTAQALPHLREIA